MTDSSLPWTVVVPVKGTVDSKSRLHPDIADGDRMRLAEAFTLDALAALAAARRVASIIVVTDPTTPLAAELGSRGVLIVSDPGLGLNGAIAEGLRAVGETRPLAVLLGDLPSLTPEAVDDALSAAEAHPLAVVPDADGAGTTLLTATTAAPPVPRFGAGSAAAHAAAGHRILALPADSPIRRDVDTAADLDAAVALGVGAHTHAALAALSPRRASGPSPRR
ncbi:2-phospho-L-lactate guanylyltransferase [Herbiconiux solani]|uniref:2-phospho-L-lactate guanylyltransferase n=1 Tax=Herbiconiux solani TaxID=661329 RepID=UPI0008253FE8|nr:2-phospho-L-lactate guanylyltransferase [Herbiconiux solani]